MNDYITYALLNAFNCTRSPLTMPSNPLSQLQFSWLIFSVDICVSGFSCKNNITLLKIKIENNNHYNVSHDDSHRQEYAWYWRSLWNIHFLQTLLPCLSNFGYVCLHGGDVISRSIQIAKTTASPIWPNGSNMFRCQMSLERLAKHKSSKVSALFLNHWPESEPRPEKLVAITEHDRELWLTQVLKYCTWIQSHYLCISDLATSMHYGFNRQFL